MNKMNSINIAIAWCLAWGNEQQPQYALSDLKQMYQSLQKGEKVAEEFQGIIDAVDKLDKLDKLDNSDHLKQGIVYPETLDALEKLTQDEPILWQSKIGLIYGGATKIKQYVFEESKLPQIRGASAALDKINTVDLPAFFDKNSPVYQEVSEWIELNFPKVPFQDALIPELVIYSCGGNILAFCPTAFVNDLANAIEKRYTEKTLTANSCAVGDTFRLLEIKLGLLRDHVKDTFWLEEYQKKYADKLVESYFGKVQFDEPGSNISAKIIEKFKYRKSFNELTTKLAIRFNQRRSGNQSGDRPTRQYPPMLETHPYLRRDETEKRSAIMQADLPGKPYFSEPSAIKRKFGDRAKRGESKDSSWYKGTSPIYEGWIQRFERFLEDDPQQKQKYTNDDFEDIEIAESLTQIGNVSNGYIAYIYADGNNMGGAIQKIRTPQAYQDFSQDVDNATKYAVFQSLAENLHPHKLYGLDDTQSKLKNGNLIHPFEIITIGGDDIVLIVPADKALQIAKMIGERFEEILLRKVVISGLEIREKNYAIAVPVKYFQSFHRFSAPIPENTQCKLSMSSGVLITAYNTPIYYAEELTQQLLKSAKKYAKSLKCPNEETGKEIIYYGGTVDFFTMKSVTMISSNIEEFRKNTLVFNRTKLHAAPYTLPELDRLIKSIKALKRAEFPKSQLYQIRSLLERGRRTTSLNYYYFRHRLKSEKAQRSLIDDFENIWCQAKTNEGAIAPWMYNSKQEKYETIWREMVDLYDLISFTNTEFLQPSHIDTTS